MRTALLRRLAPALALGALTACLGLPPAPAPTNPMRFVSLNDVYVADTLADGSGGLARVATILDRVKAEGPTLFVLAGDFLSPSLLSKYYSGRQMIDALNAAKLDYSTFGNHEFELSRDTLVARIHVANFKWLSANCREANGDAFPGVFTWDTLRLAGRKVGIFGLTLQGDYPAYVRCTDPDSAARFVIDTLVQQGAEFLVALTHQTVEADRALLNREGRLDLVLGGHEHEHMTVAISKRYILKVGERNELDVREDRPLVAEQLQRNQPGEEDGQRDAGERDAHRDPVEDRAPLQRRDHPDGYAGGQPQHRRADGERQGDRDVAGHHRPDRLLVLERIAEAWRRAVRAVHAGPEMLTDHDRPQVVPVLQVKRLVQAELLHHLEDRGPRGVPPHILSGQPVVGLEPIIKRNIRASPPFTASLITN